MGCGSCGVADKSGKVSGCGSSGGCSSGGCNRLNVFDWLADLPPSDFGKPFPIFEASFNKGSRKEFFLNNKNIPLEKGSMVTVEGTNGFDIAQVSLTGELVKLQLKKYGVKEEDVIKKLLHHTLDNEIETFEKHKEKEKETLVRARAIARTQNLDMKIGETEIQADGKKISIFYTANSRVDFRELIKVYAQEFNARIEMRQIGTRQESGKVGGIGSCGRELCCSTWLTDFKTVYTSAARYQNLSINQTKLSGQCGKLKCCLNFELDTYMDALTGFPNNAESLMMKTGKVKLVKKDIFKGLMWYCYENNNKYYPLTIERVKEIQDLNKKNIFPDELEPVEIIKENKKTDISIDAGFVNDVGQITLTSLTKKKKSSKSKHKNQDARGLEGKDKGQENRNADNRTNNPNRSKENRPASKPKPGNVHKNQGNLNTENPNSKTGNGQERIVKNNTIENKAINKNSSPATKSAQEPRNNKVDKPVARKTLPDNQKTGDNNNATEPKKNNNKRFKPRRNPDNGSKPTDN